MITDEQVEAGAKAIWRQFARVTDDADASRRWSRVKDVIKNRFREEAKACARAMMEVSNGY